MVFSVDNFYLVLYATRHEQNNRLLRIDTMMEPPLHTYDIPQTCAASDLTNWFRSGDVVERAS